MEKIIDQLKRIWKQLWCRHEYKKQMIFGNAQLFVCTKCDNFYWDHK